MPRLPAKQREAEKVATKLPDGSYAAAVNDSPARFSWDEHTKKLLGKLQGDRRKRRNTIESFIRQLAQKREEFRREKKTGAGSTTEAIEFYQYVLEKNNLWKAKAGKKSKDPAAAVGSGGFSIHSEITEEEEEFLNQHNDFCEVCGMGGELICCSTCNLVFHLKCCRPVLKSMPPDTWSCAHCDATGVTNYKKESRQRKRALTAVREMEKLQNEFKDKKSSSSGDGNDKEIKAEGDVAEDKKEESDPGDICTICSLGGDVYGCSQSVCNRKFHLACIRPTMEDPPGDDWSCPYCDVDFVTGLKPQARRRRASISGVRTMDKMKAEYDVKRKEGTISSPSKAQQEPSKKRKLEDLDKSPVHPGQPRQRSKSQGSMDMQEVNKQMTSNTDGTSAAAPPVIIPTGPRYTKADIPAEVYKKFGPKTTNTNSRHGQYNCKYCMDSDKSETCCFCACRVCFIKDDKSNTILCDLCDGEYHIYCLVPPMEKIPDTDWFCPTCTAAITKAKSNASAKSKVEAKPEKKKGKVGRPKGSGKSASKIATKKGLSKSSKKALREKKSFFSSHQPRTSSGRFAPKPKSAPTAEELVAALAVAPVVKRGPGRPPKSQTKAAIAARALAQSRKVTTTTATAASTPGGKEKPMFGASGMLASMTQQRSRSGRVVKRNTVYDEIEERTKKPSAAIASNMKKESNAGVSPTGSVQTRGAPVKPSAAAMLAAQTAASSLGQSDLSRTSQDKTHLSPVVASQDLQSPSSAVDSSQLNSLILPSSSKLSSDKQLPVTSSTPASKPGSSSKNPRRKPGARECMQISRRFGASIIPQNYMDILMDYCSRGKVEHLIRMRERLDEHSRFLESQLAGLEVMVQEKEKLKAITTATTTKQITPGASVPAVTPSKIPLGAAPPISLSATQLTSPATKPVPVLSPEAVAALSSPKAPIVTQKVITQPGPTAAKAQVVALKVSATKALVKSTLPAKAPIVTIAPAPATTATTIASFPFSATNTQPEKATTEVPAVSQKLVSKVSDTLHVPQIAVQISQGDKSATPLPATGTNTPANTSEKDFTTNATTSVSVKKPIVPTVTKAPQAHKVVQSASKESSGK